MSEMCYVLVGAGTFSSRAPVNGDSSQAATLLDGRSILT